jgi:putative multiple sugar transport system permease protein
MSQLEKSKNSSRGLVHELVHLLKKNIREYGMYIALVVIITIFAITTKGVFISPRNISTLLNQTGYIIVLAIGMTLIIVCKYIDLSVGFMAGFLGAVAAIFMTRYGMSEWLVIPIILVFGAIIGLYNGFMVGKLKIPAYVVSLAGMFIFRGLLLMVTQKTGTIIVPNKGFNDIGNGFIPDIDKIIPGINKPEKIHILTLIIGAVAIFLFILSAIRGRKNKMKYEFEVLSTPLFTIKLIFISLIIGYISWIIAGYNGLSLSSWKRQTPDKSIDFNILSPRCAFVIYYSAVLRRCITGRFFKLKCKIGRILVPKLLSNVIDLEVYLLQHFFCFIDPHTIYILCYCFSHFLFK